MATHEITRPPMTEKTGRQMLEEMKFITTDIADNMIVHKDDVPATPLPINADQLQGHPASYFATAEALSSLSSDLSALSGIVPKIVYRSEDSASYTFSEGHDNMFLVLCKSRNSDSYAVYLVLDRNALLRVNTIGNNSLTYSVSSKTMTVSGASDINMSVVKMW